MRYPRGAGVGKLPGNDLDALPFGKGEIRRTSQQPRAAEHAAAKPKLALLAFGTLQYPALKAAEALDATVVNMRWAKPLDEDLLLKVAEQHDALVTLEDGCIMGGAGSAVMEFLQAQGLHLPVLQLGLPDQFIEQGDAAVLMRMQGLDAQGIEASIRKRFIQAAEKAVQM